MRAQLPFFLASLMLALSTSASAMGINPVTCPIEVRTFGLEESLGAQRGIAALERSDGRPLVAVFANQGNQEGVWTWSCDDRDCESGSMSQLGTFGYLQNHPIVMTRANGLPLVFAEGDFGLAVFDCQDGDCRVSRRAQLPGYLTSDAGFEGLLARTGLPQLVAGTHSGPGLVMYFCSTPDCSSASRLLIPSGLGIGQYFNPVLARGPQGQIVVLHTADVGTGNLPRVMVCVDENCSNARYITPALPAGVTVWDVAMRADGRLLLLETELVGGAFFSRLRQCADSDCVSSTTVTLPTNFGFSMRIDPGGRPLIGYSGSSYGLIACTDSACSGSTIRHMGSAGTNGGAFARVTLSAEGLPMVAVADRTDGPPQLGLCRSARVMRNGFEANQ
jgi:hypothetical protein